MGRPLGLALLALVAVGCATTRVVPVPAVGVGVDVAQGTATVAAEGVQLVVRPSAWRGSPSYLPSYVTPLHVLLVNASALPLSYDYPDFRLFDDARFQYTALPPAEVGRLLQWSRAPAGVPVAAAETVGVPLRPRPIFVDAGWWGPPWWGWGPPYYYYYAPPLTDVMTRALPVGTLQAGARSEGFVYFPLVRPGVSRLSFEFHYRLGHTPGVLVLPFRVERSEREAGETAS